MRPARIRPAIRAAAPPLKGFAPRGQNQHPQGHRFRSLLNYTSVNQVLSSLGNGLIVCCYQLARECGALARPSGRASINAPSEPSLTVGLMPEIGNTLSSYSSLGGQNAKQVSNAWRRRDTQVALR